jgi:hypothetical protein
MADDAIKSEAVFTSGAKRSELKPAYHLLPPEGLKRAAERYSLGADTYGMLNYFKGINDPMFVRQILDHMEAHMQDYKINGCRTVDNLGAIMWAAMTLCVIEKHNPSILDTIFDTRSEAIADALSGERPVLNLYEGKPGASK